MAMRAAGPAWRLGEPHPPLPGESYNGYVARVAALEGHPSTFELHRVAGLEWPQRTELAPGMVEGMASLAHVLGIEPSELEDRAHAVLPDGGRTWRGMPIGRRILDLSVRRFSPASLSASDHHRALWSVRAFPFCEESWEHLQDRCPSPHCGTVQRFYYPAGPSLCDRCGEPLTGAVASLVAPDLRERLRLAVGLLHHDPARMAESLAALPEEVRGLPSGGPFALLLALARVWEPAIASRHRTFDHGLPAERIERAVAEGWTMLADWPAGFERLAAERLAERAGRFGDGNGGATLRFLLGGQNASTPVFERTLVPLRARLRERAAECPGLGAVMRASGTNPKDLAKLRREGRVGTVFALDGNRAVPRLSAEGAAAIAEARRASMLIEEAATVLGLPIYGVEQACAAGLLEWTVDPLPCAVRSPVRVAAASIDALVEAIRANVEAGPVDDPVHLDRATLGIGGRPKPWGAIVGAVADRRIRVGLADAPADVPPVRHLMVRRADVPLLRSLATEGLADFPARDRLTRAEAGEILNLRNASKAKPLLAAWPPSPSGRPVVPAEALLETAARIVHAPELAERFGLTTHGLNRALVRSDLAAEGGGYDRNRATALVDLLLRDDDAVVELARRSGTRVDVVRRLIRRVDARYRPRGRRRAGPRDRALGPADPIGSSDATPG